MLSDEVIEKVTERLVNRIEQGNEYVLKKIGESVKKVGTLTPSKAQDLVQTMKYGGDYDKIVKKLSEITRLNVVDIYKIFEEIAKSDYDFAKQFYDYKKKKYIKWEENDVLRDQVNALAKLTAEKYVDFSRSSMLGFGVVDKEGNVTVKGLKKVYDELLDEAILNVGQGKETFDSAMFRQLKQIGSGLKVLYPNGRTMRLDSAMRMHMKDAIRTLHNETQTIIGEQFDADGVEITVHEHPAPDHQEVQGRQFNKKEFDNFQNDKKATTYDGIVFEPEFEGHDRRSISQYNCYHYTFEIVLGVSKPEYSDKELREIIDRNNKGFDFEGKHYTMYEGTQLQRNLERAIREQKDNQILGRASDNKKLISESQQKITILNHKYKKLSQASGLLEKKDRLRVSGYRRVKVDIPGQKNTSTFNFEKYQEKLSKKDIRVNDSINTLDNKLVERNLKHLDYLSDKYNITDQQYLKLGVGDNMKRTIGSTYYSDNKITLNSKYFNEKERMVEVQLRNQETGWHNKINKENLDLYTLTHEYGHAVENNYVRKYIKKHHGINTDERRLSYFRKEDNWRKEIDKDIRDSLFNEIKKEQNLSITEIKNKYFSEYGKSQMHYEWFAETFAQMILGEQNEFTRALEKWLERNY